MESPWLDDSTDTAGWKVEEIFKDSETVSVRCIPLNHQIPVRFSFGVIKLIVFGDVLSFV